MKPTTLSTSPADTGRSLGDHNAVAQPVEGPFVCCLKFADFLDSEMAAFEVIKNRTKASIDRLREYRAAVIAAAVIALIYMTDPKMSGMTLSLIGAKQRNLPNEHRGYQRPSARGDGS